MADVSDWRSTKADADAAQIKADAAKADADAAKLQSSAAAAKADMAMEAALAGRVALGQKILTFTSLVSVTVATRRFIMTVTGAKIGDRIKCYIDGVWPVGYELIESTYVPAADTIQFAVQCPVLAVGLTGTINLPIAFYAIRTS